MPAAREPACRAAPLRNQGVRDEGALHVRIGGDTAGHERRTATPCVLGVEWRGRRFVACGVREAERKPEGLKQVRAGGRHK
jgi:hypothetical protein